MRLERLVAFLIGLQVLGYAGIGQAQDDSDVERPRNAAPNVNYVGSDACAKCHQDQHQSFLETLHSKAAQPTDLPAEPKPAKFDHQASGNLYEVASVDGKMVHRERLRDAAGLQIAVTEAEMETSLGSGTNARSYLCRKGDFHIQSPITYFQDDEAWSMSPGYDVPVNRSFRRTVTVTCVFCHVGTIEQEKRNPYKFEISEFKIGCERCHGPGELHVKRHQENPNWSGPDDSIVNPESLDRNLAEAICQQCHCQGVQAINVSGVNDWDFRPGLRLTDYRVDFQFRRGDNSMRLVGHVEQMHASKCYTETETLTCVSCHDPHAPPNHENKIEYFRDKCYSCHEDDACGVPNAERVSKNQNDCSQCHMPRGDTNVSHFALHDHRIGIHSDKPDRSVADAVSFQPILDISHLPAWEQKRLNGLAKYELHRRHGANPNFSKFAYEATAELIQLNQSQKSDDDVDAALAWLARDQGQTEISERLSREIRGRTQLETMPRIVATNVLASILFQRGDFPEALALYRELDGYHRDGRDTYYLGLTEQNSRNTDKAIEALKRSIEIEPSQVAAHAALRAIYYSLGKLDEAQKHQAAFERNQILQQAYARGRQKMIEEAGKRKSP